MIAVATTVAGWAVEREVYLMIASMRFNNMRFIASCLFVVAVLGISTPLSAAPLLSLSSAASLNDLTVGQTVRINVDLSGLDPGDELIYLAATIEFDPAMLGTPLAIQAGAVVPNPLSPAFVTASSAGLADGNYISLSPTENVTNNGVFYSFDVKVQQAGAGALRFQFVDSEGFNAGNPLPKVVPGGGLAFRTGTTGNVVPEPTGVWIWGTLVLMFVGTLPARRRFLRSAEVGALRSARGSRG